MWTSPGDSLTLEEGATFDSRGTGATDRRPSATNQPVGPAAHNLCCSTTTVPPPPHSVIVSRSVEAGTPSGEELFAKISSDLKI